MTQQFRVRVRRYRFKSGGELRLLPAPEKPKPAINDGAIAMVEGLLERLRSGETTDIGIAEGRANGCSSSGYSVSKNYNGLVTGAQTLSFRLSDEFKR